MRWGSPEWPPPTQPREHKPVWRDCCPTDESTPPLTGSATYLAYVPREDRIEDHAPGCPKRRLHEWFEGIRTHRPRVAGAPGQWLRQRPPQRVAGRRHR